MYAYLTWFSTRQSSNSSLSSCSFSSKSTGGESDVVSCLDNDEDDTGEDFSLRSHFLLDCSVLCPLLSSPCVVVEAAATSFKLCEKSCIQYYMGSHKKIAMTSENVKRIKKSEISKSSCCHTIFYVKKKIHIKLYG